MKTLKINNDKICFFDGAEDTPLRRYQKLNKLLMMKSDVGSTIEDYQKREIRTIQFTKKGLIDEALKEMENKAICYHNAVKEKSYTHHALALMVYSINDNVMSRIDDDSLDHIINILSGLGVTENMCNDIIFDIKKNSKKSLKSSSRISFQIIHKLIGIMKKKKKA